MIQKIKNIIINFMVRRKYDVIFKKGAATDLGTVFEGKNLVNKNAGIYLSFVGMGTYISGNTSLSRVKIGRYCSIGQHVKNSFGIHPSGEFVSTHPAFFSTKKQAGYSFVEKDIFEEHKYVDEKKKFLVEIGNDVWIGNNVVILDGIKIGDGAIIGTGALVTKDVEPYSIVGGIPAKIIRMRFTSEQIEYLEKFQWWNKDYEWIKSQSCYFSSIGNFIDRFKDD